MSDTAKLVPQALSHNELIRGEFKPHVFVRWIVLDMDLGGLDYKEYQWEELEKLWDMTRKPAQRLLKSLEDAGWLHQEKTRDGARIYLFPTNDKPQEHLEAIKKHVLSAHYRRKQDSIYYGFKGTQPYRKQYLTEHGNFTRIPYTVLDDQRFSWTDRGVYAVIRSYANARYGRTVQTMADEINMKPRAFNTSLKKWKDAGYIVYNGRRRVVNQYEFNDAPESVSTQINALEPEMHIREPEMHIRDGQRDLRCTIETVNIEIGNMNNETAVAVDQESSSFNQGSASGDAIGALAPLASATALRASVSVPLVTASARCASAHISSGVGNYAVTQTNPARQRAHNGVVYENKAQRDARVQRALQDKVKRQIARENAQKEETSNG